MTNEIAQGGFSSLFFFPSLRDTYLQGERIELDLQMKLRLGVKAAEYKNDLCENDHITSSLMFSQKRDSPIVTWSAFTNQQW